VVLVGDEAAMQPWVSEELATADFGDQRLDERFRLVVDRMSQQPSLKFPAACRGRAEVEAAYRFLDNDRVDAPKVLAPHRDATLQRIRQHALVILAQDTTEIDVTRRHERLAGAGPLGDDARLGFFNHALLALTPEKLVLGLVGATIWAREFDPAPKPAAQKRAERRAKAIEDKESVRWREGYQQACRVAREAPETLVVCVADSEGDVYECFLEGQADGDKPKAAWIIRACQNRGTLPGDGDAAAAAAKLWEQVQATPVLTTVTVEVSHRDAPKVAKDARKRKQPRRARTATLTVQAVRVQLRGPPRPGQCLPAVAVNAILVREVNPPAGEEPIEWLLLTSLPIDTVAAVRQVIAYYCVRWQIEIYFRVLKSGCKVEESQLHTAERFRPYLALCMIVAWRVMYLMMLGRECPELPCDVALDDDEWQAVYAVVKQEAPPASPPPLGTMVKLIAALGGYLGRKGDGEPGPKAMWIGMQRMADLARAWQAFPQYGRPKTPKRSVER
jgi:transposase Tn5 family protein/transposase-like protein